MQISLTDSYSTQEVQVQVILTEESLTCADARLSNDLLLNVIKKKKKASSGMCVYIFSHIFHFSGLYIVNLNQHMQWINKYFSG